MTSEGIIIWILNTIIFTVSKSLINRHLKTPFLQNYVKCFISFIDIVFPQNEAGILCSITGFISIQNALFWVV